MRRLSKTIAVVVTLTLGGATVQASTASQTSTVDAAVADSMEEHFSLEEIQALLDRAPSYESLDDQIALEQLEQDVRELVASHEAADSTRGQVIVEGVMGVVQGVKGRDAALVLDSARKLITIAFETTTGRNTGKMIDAPKHVKNLVVGLIQKDYKTAAAAAVDLVLLILENRA